MKIYEPDKPILSIHIPKCGGQSLHTVLRKWYGSNFKEHYFDEKNNRLPEKFKVKGFLGLSWSPFCIHGHFNSKRGFGVNDYYPEVKQAFTFLRHPLEIQLSVYFYNQQNSKIDSSFRDGKPHVIESDLNSYLEKSKSYIKLFLPPGLTVKNIDHYLENYFVFIGFMEEYQKSMDRLSEILNKPKINIPHTNKAERTVIPSDYSVKRFLENSAEELEIYEYLKEKCLL